MGMAGLENTTSELFGLAKRIYGNEIIDQEQRHTITYDELTEMTWDMRGAGWFGDAHLERSGSYKFLNSQEALPQDTSEVNRQFIINTVEHAGDVSFTKDFLIRLIKGNASFGDFTYKVEDLMRTSKKNLNQACYIGPRMVRTTLTANTTTTVLVVGTTQYLHVGMFIDIYDSTFTTLIKNNARVVSISGLSVTIDSAVTAVAGSSIFNHEENLSTTTGKGFNSLPFQCDDGTDFPTLFESLDRATYNAWRGNRIDAAGAPLTNDLLQRGQNTLYEVGGCDYMTEDYVNFCHLDSIRRYVAIVLPQKRYVNASKYDAGYEKPNALEWNGKTIIPDPDCGKRDWIMYNKRYGGKKELQPLEMESQFGGSTMKWKQGYLQGTVITYYSGNLGTNKSNANLIFRNLAIL